MATRKRLGDLLQERGLISEQQLADALAKQRQSGDKLGEALIELGYVSAEQIADVLSDHLKIPRVRLSRRYIRPEVVRLIPEELLGQGEVLPIESDGTTLQVAMVDPLNIMVIDDIQRATGLNVMPMVATVDEIREARQRTTDFASTARKVFDEYSEDVEEEDNRETEVLGDAPGVRLANMILQQALRQRASDVHLEPRQDDMRVRFRVDGILNDIMTVPKHLRADVSSRIKIMANLDITERRRPQDGRIRVELDGQDVDMRVSTLPTVYGEKIVARLLARPHGMLDLENFGFNEQALERIERLLYLSQGLILATGPTGSGKTTTLYGFLNQLNTPERNIITVEDPVEYKLDGVSQVQVNPRTNLTFASGLRSVLRQDPDIIMVGEVRDEETAEIAVRSALTGHLVLSTVHTNNAVASISRLIDMGIQPYLISSTLAGVIAQRLVRRICPDCRQSVPLADPLVQRFIASLNMDVPERVYQGRGCPACQDTGYRGRTVVAEVLLINGSMRRGIEAGLSDSDLRARALDGGMIPLQVDAVNKLIAGVTTASELIRTVYGVQEEVIDEGER